MVPDGLLDSKTPAISLKINEQLVDKLHQTLFVNRGAETNNDKVFDLKSHASLEASASRRPRKYDLRKCFVIFPKRYSGDQKHQEG